MEALKIRKDIYTDLARESRELHPDISGVSEQNQEENGIRISRIKIETDEAAQKLDKPKGTYITIEADELADRDSDVMARVSHVLASELENLISFCGEYGDALVVGLGNRFVTPDSLGPRVVEHSFVTRHITTHMADSLLRQIRPVSAMAPGVLGVTGVETMEVVRGLAERVKPQVILAIDSLASRRADRISTTIQLSNTGIHPGSGVGNERQGLTRETLDVPVVAIGVPTVVMASTISQDVIGLIADETGLHQDEERLKELAEKVIKEHFGPLIVTPKEIDMVIKDMSGVLAEGINRALHRSYYDEIKELLL